MVAMNVWPTDAGDGSVATEYRWRKMARWWAASGVCLAVAQELRPTLVGTNMTIAAGACWVDGHFCELAASTSFTVTARGIVVVRFDPAANTAELVYKDGIDTPTINPEGMTEIPICRVFSSVLYDCRALIGPNGQIYFDTISQRSNWTAVFPAASLNGLRAATFALDKERGAREYSEGGWRKPWGAAWGITAQGVGTSAGSQILTPVGTSLVLLGGALNLTVPVPNTRWVQIGLQLPAISNEAPTAHAFLQVDAAVGGAPFQTWYEHAAPLQTITHQLISAPITFGPGTHSVTFTAKSVVGAVTVHAGLGAYSWALDIGAGF